MIPWAYRETSRTTGSRNEKSWMVNRRGERRKGFSFLETIVGALLFSVIATASLSLWHYYSRQSEKAQVDMMATALCQMLLEDGMAVGYSGVVDLTRTQITVNSSWTDVSTGQSKPIEPSASFEYERTVTIPEEGLKTITVTVYYLAWGVERQVTLEALVYRTN